MFAAVKVKADGVAYAFLCFPRCASTNKEHQKSNHELFCVSVWFDDIRTQLMTRFQCVIVR